MKTHSKKEMLFILILSTFLGSIGQLLFKIGLSSQLYYLLFGLIAYLLSTVIYLYILGRSHLSWAYGIGSLSYIFASILAFFFLGEQISALRWLGITIIVVGAAFVGLS
jgi:uncharacterized membrane protein